MRLLTSLIVSFTLVSSQAIAQLAGAGADAGSASSAAANAAGNSSAAAGGFQVKCNGGHLPMCALVGISLAQVVMSLATKKKADSSQAQLTGADTSTGSNGDVTDGTTAATSLGLDGSSLTSAANNAKVASALASAGLGGLTGDYSTAANKLNSSGVMISPDGSKVTLPNGKTVASSAFNSPQSMADAGFSPSQIQEAQDAIAALSNSSSKKAASLTNADGSSGGGGASGGSGGSGGAGGYGGDSADALARLKAAQLANSKAVSGMSKKFGSDNIGVSGDNIFEMISRRYKARDQASSFIKN